MPVQHWREQSLNQCYGMPGREHSHSDEHDAKCSPHVPQSFGTAFVVGTALNTGYVVVQLIFGIFAHSLALIADAGHNFGDVLALLLAWGATHLASTPSTVEDIGPRWISSATASRCPETLMRSAM